MRSIQGPESPFYWGIILLATLLGLGCGEADIQEIDQARAELRDATPTYARPEVGTIGGCTATLFRSQWVIYAAHCTSPVYENTFGGKFRIVTADENPSYPIGKIYSLGEDLGTRDIAIAHLLNPVPESVAIPASLAWLPPATGDAMVYFGSGCTEPNDPYAGTSIKKRYANFTWNVTGKQRLCPGDSGGPLFHGSLYYQWIFDDGRLMRSPEIAGINSGAVYRRRRSDYDVFAYPSFIIDEIEELIRDVDGDLEIDIDRLGMDFADFTFPPSSFEPLDAATRCRYICSLYSQCSSFSLVKSTGQCFLKKATPHAVPDSNVISGVIGRQEIGVDRPGGDYTCYYISSDPDICEAQCGEDERCRAWTYVPPGSGYARCCKKDKIAPPRSSNVSGGGTQMTSGLRMGYEYDTVFVLEQERTYRNYYSGSSAPAWCQAACERDSRCATWTFHPTTSGASARCSLQDGEPYPRTQYSWQAVSGYKGKVFER